jgi:FkbM family methyltransferase
MASGQDGDRRMKALERLAIRCASNCFFKLSAGTLGSQPEHRMAMPTTSRSYLASISRYRQFAGLPEMLGLLPAMLLRKSGVRFGQGSRERLERWGFFRRLAGDRFIEPLSFDRHEFRVRYNNTGNETDGVIVAIRVPFSDSSDPSVFEQIFIRDEYGQALDWFSTVSPDHEINCILDVGANIGCAALFFCGRFPKARVFCVEPEEGNYGRLQLNLGLNPTKNIRSLRAALAPARGKLQLSGDFEDRNQWGARFVEIKPGVTSPPKGQFVEAIDIRGLAEASGFDEVDVLKVDIEGAEAGLLANPEFQAFLRDKVRRVVMEVHQEFITAEKAARILESLGFKTHEVAEFVCGVRTAESA